MPVGRRGRPSVTCRLGSLLVVDPVGSCRSADTSPGAPYPPGYLRRSSPGPSPPLLPSTPGFLPLSRPPLPLSLHLFLFCPLPLFDAFLLPLSLTLPLPPPFLTTDPLPSVDRASTCSGRTESGRVGPDRTGSGVTATSTVRTRDGTPVRTGPRLPFIYHRFYFPGSLINRTTVQD